MKTRAKSYGVHKNKSNTDPDLKGSDITRKCML